MGRAAGVGSPMWFMCAQQRKDRWKYRDRDGFLHDEPQHEVERTGRTKPRAQRGAVGVRSLLEQHEYECKTCGHIGWSNHKDVLHRPLKDTDAGAL